MAAVERPFSRGNIAVVGNVNPDIVKGPWDPKESKRLADAIEELGTFNWPAIADKVGTRCAKQCRERWHQNLSPQINRSAMAPWEQEYVIATVDEIGQKWAVISRRLGTNRADNFIKNWYNGHRNRVRKEEERLARPSAAQATSRSASVSPSQPRTQALEAGLTERHADANNNTGSLPFTDLPGFHDSKLWERFDRVGYRSRLPPSGNSHHPEWDPRHESERNLRQDYIPYNCAIRRTRSRSPVYAREQRYPQSHSASSSASSPVEPQSYTYRTCAVSRHHPPQIHTQSACSSQLPPIQPSRNSGANFEATSDTLWRQRVENPDARFSSGRDRQPPKYDPSSYASGNKDTTSRRVLSPQNQPTPPSSLEHYAVAGLDQHRTHNAAFHNAPWEAGKTLDDAPRTVFLPDSRREEQATKPGRTQFGMQVRDLLND